MKKSQKQHFKFNFSVNAKRPDKSFLGLFVDFFCPPPPSYDSFELWKEFHKNSKPLKDVQRSIRRLKFLNWANKELGATERLKVIYRDSKYLEMKSRILVYLIRYTLK